MLFDESEIEKDHAEILQVDSAKLLLAHLWIAIDIIRKSYVDRPQAPGNQAVIFSLGVRTISSAGACLKLAGSGYFAPAFHQLRDLAELGQLLEYFICKPDKLIQWSKVAGWERVDKFSFNKMDKGLKANFNIVTRWKERFEHYSELGTHVGAAGAYAISRHDKFEYGPHTDPVKFIQILAELTIDVLSIAEAYVRIYNVHYHLNINEILPDEHRLLLNSLRRAPDDYEAIFHCDDGHYTMS